MMLAPLWNGQDLSKAYWWYDEWNGYNTGPLNAVMFFCLMYLSADEIATWVISIADIEGDHWKEQIAAWLKGARTFFAFVEAPDTIPPPPQNRPVTLHHILDAAGIGWWSAFLVFGS
jgi:hypothetical protein